MRAFGQLQGMLRGDVFSARGVVILDMGLRPRVCSPQDQLQQQQPYSRAGLAAASSFGMLVDYLC